MPTLARPDAEIRHAIHGKGLPALLYAAGGPQFLNESIRRVRIYMEKSTLKDRSSPGRR